MMEARMGIDEQLAFLAARATNVPSVDEVAAALARLERHREADTASPASPKAIRAVAAGFAPVIGEQFNALRAENAMLRQRMDALEARMAPPNIRRVV